MNKLLEQPSVTSHTQKVTNEKENDEYAEFHPLLVSDIGHLFWKACQCRTNS